MQLYRTSIVPLILFPFFCFAQRIDKVEPPNWWTAMQNDTCQILIYGSQLADYQGNTETQGVSIRTISEQIDDHYILLELVVSPLAKPGNVAIELRSPSGHQLILDYPLLQRIPRDIKTVGNEDVIYLITPDRFSNGDPDNDEINGTKEKLKRDNFDGRHGGDISGISHSLNYLGDMGITTVWLNPIQKNDMPTYSYHGYAITDFYEVDPRYGSLNEYVRFVKDANQKGIKVVMDIVLNHCGFEHQWILYPPIPNWTTNFDAPYEETNHVKTAVMDPYASQTDLDLLVNGWFVRSMPDMNTRNKYVEKYLIQNTIWWIETASLSGLRVDTYPYPDKDFSKRWMTAIEKEYPGLFVVGEVWNYQPGVIAYWQKDNHNKDGFNSQLPSLFDFPIQGALINALQPNADLHTLYESVAMDFQYQRPDQFVIFGDNHDMSRMFTSLKRDYSAMKNAVTFLMTFRGIPQLFYGTEILMENNNTDKHGVIRSDFPGGWENDTINAFNTNGLNPTQIEFQYWLSKLLRWRKNTKVIHEGKLMHYEPKEGVYVFFRYNETECVMTIINRNTKDINLPLARFNQRLKPYTSATELFTGKKIKLERGLKLLAGEPVILTLSK